MQEQRSACDSCRRRKVRCDSEQPCRRCVDSGLECTYGSSLRRVSSTTYVRTLEQRVAQLQQQLQAASETATAVPSSSFTGRADLRPASQSQQPSIDLLFSASNDLVVQQPSGMRIYRFSAALNILKTITDMLNVGLTPALNSSSPGLSIVEAIDEPLQVPSRDTVDWLNATLPPETETRQMTSLAIDRALVCHQCIDKDVFEARLDELFSVDKGYMVSQNKSFMSMVYAVLALGVRYRAEGEGKVQADPHALPPGFQFFRASRCISHADLESCDLDQVLARILQARYLQSVSHISEAHSTLVRGVSVATHMGLHFDDSALQTRYTSEQLDERRRVFAVLYMMDTYISFILGLPRTLSYAHPRQTLGLEQNDLHDQGRDLVARDSISPAAETVMAQKMFHIYAKILDHQSGTNVESWLASDWVAEVQRDFQEWQAMLPELPNDPSQSRELLGQLTLRMHYTGAQILLYAPAIHHLSRERSDPNFSIDGFTNGSDCVRAAAQAVLLVEILETQNLLSGATWMNGFIVTLAASVLTYFVIHSKSEVTIEESKSAIMKAGRMLASLGQTNVANKRVYDSLSPYVDAVLRQDSLES